VDRAVLIDVGGVLVADDIAAAVATWSGRLGISRRSFLTAVYGGSDREVLVGRVSEPSWWSVVADRLRIGPDQRAQLEHDLICDGSWDRALIAHLRHIRGRAATAIVSNAWPHMRARLSAAGLADAVDEVILSCEVGCAKPDPRIYEVALQRLGADPRQALFIDDTEGHVAAARALGLAGYLHVTGAATIGEIERFLAERPGDAPSRTSQAVAATRARIPRPHSPGGDPGAQLRLCAGMPVPAQPWLRAHVGARTRFFDEQVLAAIGRGVRQIVILGAGYDDRALRFPAPGVRYFELDQAATQDDKRRRLSRINADVSALTLAPIDFRHDEVGAVLAGLGHDAGQESLLVCEGLLIYLDAAAIVRLLAGLRSRCTDASRLTASLAVHADGIDTGAVLEHANAARRHGATEPWRTILPAAAQRDLLARGGWSVGELLDEAALGGRGEPGRSVFVVARPARLRAERRPVPGGGERPGAAVNGPGRRSCRP
jgi:putative hydrolase of the HAD superfamily